MTYLKRSIFYNLGKYIVKFILIIFIALLLIIFGGSFDLTKLLHIDNVHAVTPSYWYYANDMRLYPSLVMNGNNTSQNGTTGYFSDNNNTGNIIPYVHFSNVTNGHRLVFQQDLLLSEVAYQIDIYSCGSGTPTFRDDFKVGTSSSNVQIVGSLYHTRVPIGQPGTGAISLPGPCYVDSYYINNDKTGHFSSILLNGSSGDWYILGYVTKPVGMSNTFYGNLRDTINNHTDSVINGVSSSVGSSTSNINSHTDVVTSNQNVKIENAFSNQNVKIENAFSNQTRTIIDNANSNQNIISSNATSNTQQLISNNNSNFNELNSNITDDSLDNNTGNDFFDDDKFNNFTGGDIRTLFDLIINFLNNVIDDDSVCHPLEFQLPIVHNVVSLPCMSTIYTAHFSTLYNLIQLILNGIIHLACYTAIFSSIYSAIDPFDNLMGMEIVPPKKL